MCSGPSSLAQVSIEQDSGKNWKVKYVPAEVGIHTISLIWNDTEVDGMHSVSFSSFKL